jgi:NAD(P)-dependent dehydrogenase (short-subunit alcohol dehydrogenase family)
MSQLCIVTGGANGIGEGIVRRLHDEGYTVLFCDVDKKKGEALSQELHHDNHAAHFIACDIKIVADVSRMTRAARDLDIPVHALINNAGIFPRRVFSEVSLQEWNEVISTNLTGPFLVTQQVVPLMLPHRDGVIINMASGQSFRGDALGIHYTSTKHAIRGLTKSLALALGPHGIRVNAIAPGPTLTSQALQARSREELIDRGRQLPLGRIGQPQDIAAVVSFLLSDDARYITGQTIPVNGGSDMP